MAPGLLEGFESYLAFEQRLSPLTLRAYLADISLFLVYLRKAGISVQNGIAAIIYEKFLGLEFRKKLSAATLARRQASLKSFAKFLGLKYSQPPVVFSGPGNIQKSKKLPCFLSEATISSVLVFLDAPLESLSFKEQRDRVIFLFLYTLGLRVTELISVKVSDFVKDLTALKVLGKGSKERVLPLPTFLQQKLSVYLASTRPMLLKKGSRIFMSPYLFPGSGSKSLSRIAIFLLVKKFAQEQGLPPKLSPHKFRHSIATHLLAKGANLRMIQSFLGHSSIGTVQIYTHLDLTRLRQEYDKFHPRA